MAKRKASSYRRAPYRRRRRLSRGLRTFASARRQNPASDYGYQFIPRTEQTHATFGPTYSLATPSQRQARQQAHYYGRGKYGWLKKAWKVAKPYAKKFAQRTADRVIDRYLGGGMYTGSGMYTGEGSYHDNSNEIVGSSNSDMIPRFSTKGDETGELHITHKEYIGEIYANENDQSFVNRSYPLNPGIEETFPWLSQLAVNYEEYDFEQLIFSYRSTVADVSSTNGQVGTTIMATNYNPSNKSFVDKGQMLEYSGANSAKTTENCMHGVECDDEKLSGASDKYVRHTILEKRDDIKEYDHGLFQLATANTPSVMSNNSIGELWVSYTVTLRKPKLFSGRGSAISSCILYATSSMGVDEAENGVNADHNTPFGKDAIDDTRFPTYMSIAQKSSFRPQLLGDYSDQAVILPGNLAGVFKITMRWKGEIDGPNAASIRPSPPALFGNVKPWMGALGGGQNRSSGSIAREGPDWWASTGFRVAANLAQSDTCTLEFYIRVAPASNGVNNGFIWAHVPGSTTILTAAEAASTTIYYKGNDNSNAVNQNANCWEGIFAAGNNAPSGQDFRINTIYFEMTEISTSQEQDKLEHPALENYFTGETVTIE